MPNWCNNDVVITHSDPARLEALANKVVVLIVGKGLVGNCWPYVVS